MKFSCEKYILQSAVMTASRAAAAKSPLPALEGLLIKAGAGVSVTGYDLKKGIYTTIEADVARPGSAVFSAKLFVEMIRRMPDGIVTVEVGEDGGATVRCGRAEYAFIAMDTEDYPELPAVDYTEAVSIPQKLLREMIDETIFAVSTNESRPIYMGSLFDIENGELTLVSVDGYRLALRRERIEGCGPDGMRFIIPGAALTEVQRICGDNDEPVQINVGAKHVSFTIGDTVVISRRLEGEFLSYKKAIPENFRKKVKVDRAEFLSIVDRVSLIVDEKLKSPIRLIFGDGSINFLCVTPIGRAEDVCPCEGEGGDTEIGFNDRYLRDALRAAPENELTVCINTGSSPCVLLPTGEEEKFIYMILPVRLRAGNE
ncbi:MAG TPA: DNA polymerase III subunit beta [Clostridiales bacterium]|nr:DNA polymerase III subunit beta [Clostridiales bacterium]